MSQDHDGSHIKGLLINFLDHFYPSLLKIPEFLVEFVTPIVRVTKGKQRIDFFTIPEYEQWVEETPDAHKWEVKYYKVCSNQMGYSYVLTWPTGFGYEQGQRRARLLQQHG